MIRGQRFNHESIKGCAINPTFLQSANQSCFIHQGATCRVDEIRSRFHFPKLRFAQHAAVFFR
jgi:hypothetical protein